MIRVAAWLVLSVAIGLELSGGSSLQERSSAFVLGVLRRDGLVTPFAAFDGRRWRARWPDVMRNTELPISLDNVPESWWGLEKPPRTMTVWRDAVRAGSLNLTGLTTARPMCEPRVVVRSDYRAQETPPPPFERPYPKDGLAIAGEVTIEKIESVEKGSADWNRAVILLTEHFNYEENAAIREFTNWRHPVSAERRKLVPVTMEAVYRGPTSDAGWTAYFAEAVRQYPPGREDRDGCGLATFASGWIVVGPEERSKVRIGARVTYCDRKGVGYMLPFGFVRANSRVYWIFQFSGFEWEFYEVGEPRRDRTEAHLVYRAGSCPG